MEQKRRGRGFERAGSFGLPRGALPERRARELYLAQAWRRIAGAAISQRARAISIRRGTLEIEVDRSEAAWGPAVAELLPELAARLAAAFPELKIRRFRLCDASGGAELAATRNLEPRAAHDAPQRSPRSRPGAAVAEGERADPAFDPARIERLMERYLERSESVVKKRTDR